MKRQSFGALFVLSSVAALVHLWQLHASAGDLAKSSRAANDPSGYGVVSTLRSRAVDDRLHDSTKEPRQEGENSSSTVVFDGRSEGKALPAFRIPHRLIFTTKGGFSDLTSRHSDNVKHTVASYEAFWSDAQVMFLNDTQCRALVETHQPALLKYFDASIGPFKADICRAIALQLYGGYYFDVDMRLIEAITFNETVSFVTVEMTHNYGFFQSFVASEPHHPIWSPNVDKMLEYYTSQAPASQITRRGRKKRSDRILRGQSKGDLMGPRALKDAYQNLTKEQKAPIVLLEECNMLRENTSDLYPFLIRENGGLREECNFIVHDPINQKPYFWSRLCGDGDGPFQVAPTSVINTLK